jgi:hypothetical protein
MRGAPTCLDCTLDCSGRCSAGEWVIKALRFACCDTMLVERCVNGPWVQASLVDWLCVLIASLPAPLVEVASISYIKSGANRQRCSCRSL